MIQITVLNEDGTFHSSQSFLDQDAADDWISELDPALTVRQAEVDSAPYWVELREERDIRLQASDWTQLSDAPLSSEQKSDYVDYRQALRDLPEQEGLNPSNPTWPVKPS